MRVLIISILCNIFSMSLYLIVINAVNCRFYLKVQNHKNSNINAKFKNKRKLIHLLNVCLNEKSQKMDICIKKYCYIHLKIESVILLREKQHSLSLQDSDGATRRTKYRFSHSIGVSTCSCICAFAVKACLLMHSTYWSNRRPFESENCENLMQLALRYFLIQISKL